MIQQGDTERSFRFTNRDFQFISRLVKDHTGITLPPAKKDLVYNRLVRRLRKLNMNDFKSYCGILKEPYNEEIGHFINAITTNLTYFFREPHHFEFVKNKLIPQWRSYVAGKRIRLWSAGCSTGEEPYSLAIALKEALPDWNRWDIKILATDLDSNVLEHAKKGVYNEEGLRGLSKERIKKWFRRGINQNAGQYRIHPDIQAIVRFKRLNLISTWPIKGPMNSIFCRNVVIYFDKSTQSTLMQRYAELLTQDGYLFLGHSESLFRVSDRFTLVGDSIYKLQPS